MNHYTVIGFDAGQLTKGRVGSWVESIVACSPCHAAVLMRPSYFTVSNLSARPGWAPSLSSASSPMPCSISLRSHSSTSIKAKAMTTASDSASSDTQQAAAATEAASATDAASQATAQSAAVSESASASDATGGSIDAAVARSESATASDSQSASFTASVTASAGLLRGLALRAPLGLDAFEPSQDAIAKPDDRLHGRKLVRLLQLFVNVTRHQVAT